MRLLLNGSPVVLDGVHPTTTLLDWLRARGLTGTKEGCAEGDCGACCLAVRDPAAFRAVIDARIDTSFWRRPSRNIWRFGSSDHSTRLISSLWVYPMTALVSSRRCFVVSTIRVERRGS